MMVCKHPYHWAGIAVQQPHLLRPEIAAHAADLWPRQLSSLTFDPQQIKSRLAETESLRSQIPDHVLNTPVLLVASSQKAD